MRFEYIALFKPYGVVCRFSGEGKTLKDFVPVAGVYPVGRLDKDSEGLVLLTNDGAWQHRVSHPKFEHEKTYWAQVEGVPSEEALDRLRRGMAVRDYVTRPAAARKLEDAPRLAPRDPPIRYRAAIPDSWIEIKLHEGRNRQVRHMLAAVGHPVLRLVRVAIGDLRLGELRPGEWRRVRRGETLR